jgi:CRISPR/Cas system-associated protein Cas10 (large subunit of type III CRISPR-Cas system)
MAVVRPKFPIAKAAELAGEAEEAAKHFRDGQKNAFHFLGMTVSWDKEFDYVKSFKHEFVDMITTYGLSKSILHKIMLYASMAALNKIRRKKGLVEDFSYMWHISYYMTRYMERYKSNEVVRNFCRNLRDRELVANNGRNLELISLAARWAELLLRDQNK